MNRRFLAFCLCSLLVSSSAMWAQPTYAPLASLPELKEVQLREGEFRVAPNTKILVEFGHQSEDRIAAETLAEEIADQSGIAVNIIGAKSGVRGEGNAIILARLQHRRVRQYLASKGLKADDAIGDQGYVLFSDRTHVVVAANTGQGLFSGVQTLRQLLHRDGNRLTCPAVAIRDWPGSPWRGPADKISRGSQSARQAGPLTAELLSH